MTRAKKHPKSAPAKLAPEAREEARAMRAQGMSVSQIAEALNVSETTVRRATVQRDARPTDAAGVQAQGIDWASVREVLGFYVEIPAALLDNRCPVEHRDERGRSLCAQAFRDNRIDLVDGLIDYARVHPRLARILEAGAKIGPGQKMFMASFRIGHVLVRNHVLGAPVPEDVGDLVERVPSYAEEHGRLEDAPIGPDGFPVTQPAATPNGEKAEPARRPVRDNPQA